MKKLHCKKYRTRRTKLRRLIIESLDARLPFAFDAALVLDIYEGTPGGNPTHLAQINNDLYFNADDGINGFELWKTDGTAGGTVLLADINPDGSSYPEYLTNCNGTLFFRADKGVNGSELWKSDGTAEGTVLVKDISVGGGGSFPSQFTFFGGYTYFFAANDDFGREFGY